MKTVIPASILDSHIAILGKTGSGKTSTVKLIVETIVKQKLGHVCILDPIKSDHWGLTSSSDGKQPGLPFTILGGPHGHIPLNSRTGAEIGELVGKGQLPLSILDFADFEPGGMQRFFPAFANAFMRNMSGVCYLVIEEAHEFAPKERLLGDENQMIHYAKKLATAGRSKGIRLIVATHSVQSLHNSLLGSCDTMILHKLTLPAHQKPVLDWMKANGSKEQVLQIEQTLSAMRTGSAWMCSAEAGIFDIYDFPRITTYDNSATPKHSSKTVSVKTADVDLEQLRSLLGRVVEEAEANDPKKLKATIADLQKQLRTQKPAAPIEGMFTQAQVGARVNEAVREHRAALSSAQASLNNIRSSLADIQKIAARFGPDTVAGNALEIKIPELKQIAQAPAVRTQPLSAPARAAVREPSPTDISPTSRKIIDAIHRASPVALSFDAAATRAGVSKRSSALPTYRKQVLASDEIVVREDGRLTSASGFQASGAPGVNPVDEFERKLPASFGRMLRCIADSTEPLTRIEVATQANVSQTSSGLDAGLKELIALGLVIKIDDFFSLHPDLQ